MVLMALFICLRYFINVFFFPRQVIFKTTIQIIVIVMNVSLSEQCSQHGKTSSPGKRN